MKRLFMLLCAVVAFAACEQAPIKEMQGAAINERNLEVSFEGSDDTRIQLNEAQKTVWTEGDHVSVFYRSTVNEEWQFDGKTGDRIGNIVPVDNTLNPPATHNRVVVIYPYNNEYYLNTETYSIEASLPAVQNYLEDSYGTNGNIMVSSGDYKQVSLKSVCGWLKLQLTGDGEVVKSITLRGNNGEQVAGELYINTSDATCVLASASGEAGESEVGGTLVRPGTILTEVTLDCGEGVTLGEEATAFYIALPPQTFENGFTVEITCTDDTVMVKSSSNALTIERNTIQPMAAMEFTPSVPNNQIWYTSSDGNIVEPNNTNVFGANIVSNTYTNGKGVITFDGDVTTIGDKTFAGCYSLTSVTIGDSVTTIGDYAFQDCTSLTSVNIPDSVTTIGGLALYYCTSLTSVNIGNSVTTIGYCAFAYCTSLTSVTIGDSVTTIGDYAFDGCNSLTSVTIGDSVTVESVAEALRYCRSLQEFKGKFASEDGRCLIDDGVLYYVAPGGLTAYTIPDSVTEIGGDAFAYCTSLTSVNIPDSVTEIGRGAFHSCTSLTSVNIPDSVTATGERTFCNCTSLTSVNIPDSVTWIGEGAFSACTSLTSVNIPDSVTWIGGSAFSGCTSLTSVNIPDSVTDIGWFAFSDCTSLKKVYCYATIPPFLGDSAFSKNASGRRIYVYEECVELYKSVWSDYKDSIYTNGQNCPDTTTIEYTTNDGNTITPYNLLIISNIYENGVGTLVFSSKEIPSSAFYSCDSLTSVTIPDSVTTIGNWAFLYCRSLTSVNIPDSVTKIGDYAFYDCTSLTSVYCKATTPPSLGGSVFDNNGSGRKIYVPAGSVNAYKSAEYWREYASAIVGYDFEKGEILEVQPNNEIWYTSSDGNIVTPAPNAFNVNIISNAYLNGRGIIQFDGDVTEIGDYAFCNRDSITSVTIPDSVTEFGKDAFYGCSNLNDVYCKATIPSILNPTSLYNDSGYYGKYYYDEYRNFKANASDRKIYVPAGSVEVYKSAEGWSEYASAIIGYDFENGVVVE